MLLHVPVFKYTNAAMACEEGPGTQSSAEPGSSFQITSLQYIIFQSRTEDNLRSTTTLKKWVIDKCANSLWLYRDIFDATAAGTEQVSINVNVHLVFRYVSVNISV